MGRYYFGQIVEALIHDGKHSTKARPVLILDQDPHLNSGEPILVVPISHTPNRVIPHYHIQVHSDYQQDEVTKLNCPCWAKCNWAMVIDPKRILRSWGYMPDAMLELIVEKYDEIANDPDFNDWVTR
jgi:mRNA-degrading endonuclease toxin of MazEF toxin-antitoxin module